MLPLVGSHFATGFAQIYPQAVWRNGEQCAMIWQALRAIY